MLSSAFFTYFHITTHTETAQRAAAQRARVLYETGLYIFLNFTVAERAAKSTKINNPNDRSNGYNRERQMLKKRGAPGEKYIRTGENI